MSIEKFTPDELEVVGTFPGFGKLPRYNYPITPKENLIRLYEGKTPMWIPSPSEMATIMIDCDPENVARGRTGGVDGYGVEWVFVQSAGGAMVKPGNPKVKDIDDWENSITIPDPDTWDFICVGEDGKYIYYLDYPQFMSNTVQELFYLSPDGKVMEDKYNVTYMRE